MYVRLLLLLAWHAGGVHDVEADATDGERSDVRRPRRETLDDIRTQLARHGQVHAAHPQLQPRRGYSVHLVDINLLIHIILCMHLISPVTSSA